MNEENDYCMANSELQALSSIGFKEIFDALSDLSWGFTYIVCLNTDKVLYYNQQWHTYDKTTLKKIRAESFFTLLNNVSGINRKDFEWLKRHISSYLCRNNITRHLFTIELPCILNGEEETLAAYRFTPIVDSKSFPRQIYLIGRICLATGLYINKLTHTELGNSNLHIITLGDNDWAEETIEKLSSVEKSVIDLSAAGVSLSEIATRINKSENAVKSIKRRIFAKLNTDSMLQAIMMTLNRKLGHSMD